ncbi:hypothetical protein A9X00_15605 [Mycobacterium sp. 1245805.9]|nr:hypothetical protein A9X00_15605 [Mycobacterium sp. 1245805.9]
MTDVPGISRRRLLTTSAVSAALGAGIGGGAVLLWSQARGPAVWFQPDRRGAPPVTGLTRGLPTASVVCHDTTTSVAAFAPNCRCRPVTGGAPRRSG